VKKHPMAEILAKLTGDEAVAVWNALAQWADNTRAGVEEDEGTEPFIPGGLKGLEAVEGVVEKLNGALVRACGAEA